jgi:Spy/CpxP family protein refolding chaperone
MTDPSNNADPIPVDDSRRRGRGRTAIYVALIALAAGLTGAFATAAFSGGYGPGFGAWHGRGFMLGRMEPAQIEDRADRMVRHLAIEVDATAEQQEQLRAVVKAAVKDLLPMGEQARAARVRGRELFTQSTVDIPAIEAFRAEQVALADAASKRIAKALTDAATILTADQRRKLGDLVRPHPGFWRGWHRG